MAKATLRAYLAQFLNFTKEIRVDFNVYRTQIDKIWIKNLFVNSIESFIVFPPTQKLA